MLNYQRVTHPIRKLTRWASHGMFLALTLQHVLWQARAGCLYSWRWQGPPEISRKSTKKHTLVLWLRKNTPALCWSDQSWDDCRMPKMLQVLWPVLLELPLLHRGPPRPSPWHSWRCRGRGAWCGVPRRHGWGPWRTCRDLPGQHHTDAHSIHIIIYKVNMCIYIYKLYIYINTIYNNIYMCVYFLIKCDMELLESRPSPKPETSFLWHRPNGREWHFPSHPSVSIWTVLKPREMQIGHLAGANYHWIGLRENLQETMVFTIKYRAFL